jgi:hypothetical protein
VFELFMLAEVILAAYILAAIAYYRAQTPVIPAGRPLPLRERLFAGLVRLAIFITLLILCLWAASHMDCGLSFREIVLGTLGVPFYELANVAALCTLTVVLITIVATCALFFYRPRVVTQASTPTPAGVGFPPRPRPPAPLP